MTRTWIKVCTHPTYLNTESQLRMFVLIPQQHFIPCHAYPVFSRPNLPYFYTIYIFIYSIYTPYVFLAQKKKVMHGSSYCTSSIHKQGKLEYIFVFNFLSSYYIQYVNVCLFLLLLYKHQFWDLSPQKFTFYLQFRLYGYLFFCYGVGIWL